MRSRVGAHNEYVAVEPGLAGVVAIAIERMRFLEERKSAELARQSEELKTYRTLKP